MYQYMHIPKTGGVWFRHFIRSNAFDIESHGFHSMRLKDVDADRKAIFCLRHPVDRFLSALRMRWSNVRSDSIEVLIDYFFGNQVAELNILFAPLTEFIGNLEEYKKNQHRVAAVFDFDTYPHSVYQYFPTANTDLKNTRLNDSKHNVNWGITRFDLNKQHTEQICAFYAEDLALYEYIKQQPYYIKGE